MTPISKEAVKSKKKLTDKQMWQVAMKMYSGWKFEDAMNDICRASKKPIISFDWFVKQFRKL